MDKVQENYWNYEQISKEERVCPKCLGKNYQTFFSSMVMTSNPPQQRWYWECNDCGYEELGGVHVHEPIRMNVMI